MADILIRNMELTDGPITLVLYPNGDVDHLTQDNRYETIAKAVEIPSHGDLIDRNQLPIIGITDYKLEGHTVVEFEDVLNAPIIVEASNGTDN